MLIYSKKVDNQVHLYGTVENLPSESDNQLVYLNVNGQTPDPAPAFPSTNNDYLYLDGASGTLRWKKNGVDQGQLNVFINKGTVGSPDLVAVIPKDFVKKISYYSFTFSSTSLTTSETIPDPTIDSHYNDGSTVQDVGSSGTISFKDSEGNTVTTAPAEATEDFTVTVYFLPQGGTEQNLGTQKFTVVAPAQVEEQPEG